MTKIKYEEKLLTELHEPDASENIKAIYEKIKHCCHVPFVALLYRHLATYEGLLEWSWELLEPLINLAQFQEYVDSISDIDNNIVLRKSSINERELSTLSHLDIAAIKYIIESYNAANAKNIIILYVLQSLLAKNHRDAAVAAQRPRALPEYNRIDFPLLGRPIKIDLIHPKLLAQLIKLRTNSDGEGRQIVPTMYRHLSYWPKYLMHQSKLLEPHFADGSIERVANKIRKEAQQNSIKLETHICSIQAPPRNHPHKLGNILDQFAQTISEMIVVGQLLRISIPVDKKPPSLAKSH